MLEVGSPNLTACPITQPPNPVTNDPSFVVLPRSDGRTVYHLGVPNPPLPADGDMTKTYNFGPYFISGISVPAHWWNARWTDRSKAPIKIIRSPADIVKARRAFPYGNAGVPVGPYESPVRYTLMGSSCITVYEPTTGERSDIGLITDFSALFMLGGDPTPMIDWALCSESCPFHFRDPATDQPIDLIQYPLANAYDLSGYMGSPFLPKGPPADPKAPGYSSFGGGWQPQQAHQPELTYIAFEATGDLGFLEELGFQANFGVLCNSSLSGTSAGAIVSGEMRGIGWALRNLFMAYAATVDAEAAGVKTGPGTPFKTSSYWLQLSNQSLIYYANNIAADNSSVRTVFNLLVSANPFAPWQVDYDLTSLAFGVLVGVKAAGPIFLRVLQNAIDRLSGTSGFPPGWGGAYYLDSTQPSWAAAFTALQTNNQGGVTPTAAQVAALQADPFNGYVSMQGGEYLMTTRAVIVMAQYLDNLGLLAVRQKFPNLDTCYATVQKMIVNAGVVNPRDSVITDATQVSTVIVPYQPNELTPVVVNPVQPTPTPVPVVNAPPPDLSPTSFAFEQATPNDAVTDQDSVAVDLTGKLPTTTNSLVDNVKGNGNTVVYVTWPDVSADFFKPLADTPAGAKVWQEAHGTGNMLRLYSCSALKINGVDVTGSPWSTPVPVPAPEPTPTPQPSNGGSNMADPTETIVEQVTSEVAQIKADVAAEISAIHARLAALSGQAAGLTSEQQTTLQQAVTDLSTLHTTLTGDTAALPNATS